MADHAPHDVVSRPRQRRPARSLPPETVRPSRPERASATKSWWRGGGRWREAATTQLFLIPVGLVFVVLFAIPLSRSVYYSFTNFDGYSDDVDFVGLRNYGRIFSDSAMSASLSFTLLFAIGTTILVTMIAIPLAVILDRKFAGRNFVRAAFFFPAIPSIAVLGLVWTFILAPLASGVLNSTLETLFNIGPFPWLSDPGLARVSTVFVGVWAQAGWHAILYLAYLQSIPSDYYEAATIDGASSRQQFFRITLPLLMPAMTISQLLLLTNGLKVYDLPFTLTGGGPGYSTFTITQSIIRGGLAQGRFGEASALAVVFMLVVLAVILSQLTIARRLEARVL